MLANDLFHGSLARDARCAGFRRVTRSVGENVYPLRASNAASRAAIAAPISVGTRLSA